MLNNREHIEGNESFTHTEKFKNEKIPAVHEML